MKLNQFFLLLLSIHAGSAVYDPSSYTDRECGTDLSNLWLDVVAVVDNSIGMTNSGLLNIAADIASVFSNGTKIGKNSNEPKTTRLGLVTYSSEATTNADLNKFKSLNDIYTNVFAALTGTSNTTTTYLAKGLEAAEALFSSQSIGTPREHYKRVVIVYASAYQGSGELDPLPVAQKLRSDGAFIVTVAYNQGDGELLKGLQKIATPGFTFKNTDLNVVGEIQGALLQANCFCPNNWVQYRQSYRDVNSFRYGSCLQAVTIAASWKAAQMNCRSRSSNTYLVSEFSQEKHVFLVAAVKNTTGFNFITYHIGLNYLNNVWAWDQPVGLSPVPEQDSWSNWITGYPKNAAANSGAQNLQTGFDADWQNIPLYTAPANYFCETYSCDTDIYCDANFVNNL
ncbi:unnamed protein product [Caenorhabditis brenneri]